MVGTWGRAPSDKIPRRAPTPLVPERLGADLVCNMAREHFWWQIGSRLHRQISSRLHRHAFQAPIYWPARGGEWAQGAPTHGVRWEGGKMRWGEGVP